MTVSLTGYGLYRPDGRITGQEIAEQSGLPEEIVLEKMGIHEKRVCQSDTEHVTDMCVEAGKEALTDAEITPEELDMVLYHGSEYKDYVVWSAAADIAHRLGAENAYATESHTLCASTPVAIRQTKAQLDSGDIDVALHVTASREEDLVDYRDHDASFMFNFGCGGGAYVLESAVAPNRRRARIRESAAITDGSFAQDVLMPAGGSQNPTTPESVASNRHSLTVRGPDDMKERLEPVSGANFLSVADEALEQSGYTREDVGFLAMTHMKRSFAESLVDQLELEFETDCHYLEEYGHVQSVDQFLALDEGLDDGRLQRGDVVLFLAAGTGYTWSATVLDWCG